MRTNAVTWLSLVLLGTGLGTGVAAAAPASTITSPADGTLLFQKDPPRRTLAQIEGAATGVSKVDVNCYYGDSANVGERVATGVSVVGGRFSVPLDFEHYGAIRPCVLRAVPEGDTGWYPPGDDVPYVGPRIAESGESIYTYDPITRPDLHTWNYGDDDSSFVAHMTISSAGQCALGGALLFSPGQLTASERTFRCDGGLRAPPHEKATPTGVTVDGVSAFPPGTTYGLNNQQPVASSPQLSVTQTFDPATSDFSIDEHDPLAICANRPAQPESCETWTSAGVELERTWRTTDSSQLALMSDTWRSTDGRPHTVALAYQLGEGQGPAGGAFQFPSQVSFARFPAGFATSPPAGPATVLYSENLGTPSSGDDVHPFVAITYSGSPSSYQEIEEEFESGMGAMYYQDQLPAGGSSSVQMGFSQAYSLEQVRALAAQAELAMRQRPSESVTPSSGGSPTPSASPPSTQQSRPLAALISAKTEGGKVVIKVACRGWVGASCTFDALLSSDEKLRGSRLLAVAAARKSTRLRRVTIATAKRSLGAGTTLSITLAPNGIGRQLLKRFHRLPVSLTLAELQGGKRAVLGHQALKLVPSPAPKPKHRTRPSV